MAIYLIEVIYHKEAPFLADQEVEERLSEVVMCQRLTEGIRDGVDGGEECFDVFLVETEGLLSRIEEDGGQVLEIARGGGYTVIIVCFEQ